MGVCIVMSRIHIMRYCLTSVPVSAWMAFYALLRGANLFAALVTRAKLGPAALADTEAHCTSKCCSSASDKLSTEKTICNRIAAANTGFWALREVEIPAGARGLGR